MENNIKKAFDKVKEDINLLNNEILGLKITMDEFKLQINELNLITKNIKNELENIKKSVILAKITIPTIQQINPTDTVIPTHFPTDKLEIQRLKTENLGISTGNQGVPTDKQTNRQTDKQTDNPTHFLTKNEEILEKSTKINEINATNIESNIKDVVEILESLDTIKKEIRLKFKHLTHQEMLVFSSLYQLEETNQEVTYKLLSTNLKLSESSIRDYIQRIINKGIPIKKEKINNKKIILSISSELKKIVTLSTIIRLREL